MIISKTKIQIQNLYYGLHNADASLSIAEAVELVYEKIKRMLPNLYYRLFGLGYINLAAADVKILLAKAISTQDYYFSLSCYHLGTESTEAIRLQGTLITSLNLSRAKLGVYNYDGLGAAAIRALQLQGSMVHNLNLSSNNLGIAGIRALDLHNTAVQAINVSLCDLTATEIRALMRIVIHTPVKILDLNSNKLGVVEARILAALLPSTQIHTLDLTDTSLPEDGLKILAAGLYGSRVTRILGHRCAELTQVLQHNLARKQDTMIALGNVAVHSNNRLSANVLEHIASFLSSHDEIGKIAVAAMDQLLSHSYSISGTTFRWAQLAFQQARYKAYESAVDCMPTPTSKMENFRLK